MNWPFGRRRKRPAAGSPVYGFLTIPVRARLVSAEEASALRKRCRAVRDSHAQRGWFLVEDEGRR